jgi:hypothetical protein
LDPLKTGWLGTTKAASFESVTAELARQLEDTVSHLIDLGLLPPPGESPPTAADFERIYNEWARLPAAARRFWK